MRVRHMTTRLENFTPLVDLAGCPALADYYILLHDRFTVGPSFRQCIECLEIPIDPEIVWITSRGALCVGIYSDGLLKRSLGALQRAAAKSGQVMQQVPWMLHNNATSIAFIKAETANLRVTSSPSTAQIQVT